MSLLLLMEDGVIVKGEFHLLDIASLRRSLCCSLVSVKVSAALRYIVLRQ